LAFGGGTLAAAGGAVIVTLIALRAGMLMANATGGARSPLLLLQAMLVAAAYDMARALALVLRPGHGTRRSAGHAP
jgi:hypothetical protein